MVNTAIRDKSEFGIVRAKDDGILKSGCTVTVEKVLTEYPDGRLDIVTEGRRRFEILGLNQDRAFLQGEIEFFDDSETETIPEELKARAVRGYEELAGAGGGQEFAEPAMDDRQLSFQLAQSLQDLDLQSRLLSSRSELDRLRQLTQFLEQQIPRAKQTARMRELAPRNGFGHKIAGV